MSKKLVDIVNFNADASCYSSAKWIEDLEGGKDSKFCRWLKLYTINNKKISLGLIGATIADIKYFNPEAIELINNNQDIFEIILRPWSHDIGIYRNNETFVYNVQKGIAIIENEFENISRYFLSPEFMINSKQIELLKQFDIKAIFINPNRYDGQIASRLSTVPYEVVSTNGTKMNCISINGISAKSFLKSMQLYDKNIWNNSIESIEENIFYSWRDGESSFLLPDSISREEFWLGYESEDIKRVFLNDIEIKYVKTDELKKNLYKTYPIHSFLAWAQEMKMMWYIDTVSVIEKSFERLSCFEKAVFLQLINSDILASVEKKSPIIDIVIEKNLTKFTIYREEKGFEGEEYLSILENKKTNSTHEFLKKFQARRNYFEREF